MAQFDFLSLEGGLKILRRAITAFTGNPNEIIATDAQGRLDASLLPEGVEVEQLEAVAAENIAAGDWVNVFESGGAISVRKADAANQEKVCNGFCLEAITQGSTGLVSLEGRNTAITAPITDVGKIVFLSTTPGQGITIAPPLTAGYINQRLGEIVGVNAIRFEPMDYELIDL